MYMFILSCMYKLNILKRIAVKDQNLLNVQKITQWFAFNAILLTQGIYNNSVLVLIITYYQYSVYKTIDDDVTQVGTHLKTTAIFQTYFFLALCRAFRNTFIQVNVMNDVNILKVYFWYVWLNS